MKFKLLAGFVVASMIAVALVACGSGAGAGGGGGGGGNKQAQYRQMLDTTFGSSGTVQTTIVGTQGQGANAVAIQPDGKIVVAGYSASGITSTSPGIALYTVARYNTDGTLDTTFGSPNGWVTTNLTNLVDKANAVAIQADEKIVVAGTFGLVRYNNGSSVYPDGSLDTTFGTGGIQTGFTGFNGNAIAIQPSDEKIVVAGNNVLTRFNSNGSLDTTTFGGGKGYVWLPYLVSTSTSAYALQIDSNGYLVVAGCITLTSGARAFFLARYNTSGSLDTTFGSPNGWVTTEFGKMDDEARALQIQSDGKLVAAGFTEATSNVYTFALARYNTNGNLDTTFGEAKTGMVTTAFGTIDDEALALGIVPTNQKLVAAGFTVPKANSSYFALACYNTDGTLDTNYNSTGKVETDVGAAVHGSDDQANALAIQSNGQPVAVGNSFVPGSPGAGAIGLARYEAVQ
jgi:uncharacterized delta-60 repeat protein